MMSLLWCKMVEYETRPVRDVVITVCNSRKRTLRVMDVFIMVYNGRIQNTSCQGCRYKGVNWKNTGPIQEGISIL